MDVDEVAIEETYMYHAPSRFTADGSVDGSAERQVARHECSYRERSARSRHGNRGDGLCVFRVHCNSSDEGRLSGTPSRVLGDAARPMVVIGVDGAGRNASFERSADLIAKACRDVVRCAERHRRAVVASLEGNESLMHRN